MGAPVHLSSAVPAAICAKMLPMKTLSSSYPLHTVLSAVLIVLFVIIAGSYVVDAIWGDFHAAEDTRYGAFRGVCYWVGDTRTLNRISLYGYTDYLYDLSNRHISNLPDRSWWPVFPLLTAGMIQITGDGVCSGWTVNIIAVVLLVPVIQALTHTHRLALLVGMTLIPFALWLYVGMAEGVFLLFSGLLWLLCEQARHNVRQRNIVIGGGALLLGTLVGLTKPNSLTLIPAFLTMSVLQSRAHMRAHSGNAPRWSRLRLLLHDANPGWAGLLAATGITLGNGLWFYQTSGYYPFYVLLAQRTLWFKQFYAGDLASLLDYFSGALEQIMNGSLDLLGMERLLRLSAVLMIGVLALQGLPPRWPGSRARHVPLYARMSLLAIPALMLYSGQAHAITRYAMGNIFFVVLYLRYVYGTEGEPPFWKLPGIWLRGRPGAFTAFLRIVVFLLGPLLTLIVLVIGPALGI